MSKRVVFADIYLVIMLFACTNEDLQTLSAPNQSGQNQQPPVVVPNYGINPFGDGSDPLKLDAGSESPPSGPYLQITTGMLYVRNGPAFENTAIGKAPHGSYYPIVSGPKHGWYEISYNGGTGWVNGGAAYVKLWNSVPAPVTDEVVTIPFDYQFNDGGTYHIDFKLHLTNYVIENGDEFVIDELSRVQSIVDQKQTFSARMEYLWNYLTTNDENSEALRHKIENAVCKNNGGANCVSRLLYKVGNHTIDTSGYGNIAYGYFVDRYLSQLNVIAQIYADYQQKRNKQTQAEARNECGNNEFCYKIVILRTGDNPDDRTQIKTGRILSNLVKGNGQLDQSNLNSAADQAQLF